MKGYNLSSTDGPSKELPALSSDLGGMRTIMAADRTLMAWIRTALSMYSFGFTIYKFLEAAAPNAQHTAFSSPQTVGLFLVGMGTLAMVLGLFSYWSSLKDLRRLEVFRLTRPILIIATVMTIGGVALFFAISGRVI